MNYGALKSIPKNTTINGQPHQLSYIRPDEAELLKRIGGSGQKVNDVPAYFFFGGSTGFGSFGDSVGDSVSSGFQAVSDAGKAAVDFISDAARDVYQGTANVLTPGEGTTYVDGTLMSDNLAIDATIAANPGSTYDGDTIKSSEGETIKIGTNVNADDVELAQIGQLLPGGNADINMDGIPDIQDFQTRYNIQSIAAELDPQGGTTATGFLVNNTFNADMDGDGVAEVYTGGKEYTVNTDGSVVDADGPGDNTQGLSLLGDQLVDLGLATNVPEGEFADGSGITDLTDDVIIPVVDEPEVVDPPEVIDDSPGEVTKIVTKTITPLNYGSRSSGGIWDRFANSPYTRFGVSPMQTTITTVNQSDGSTLYYDQEGNLIDPNTLA